MREVPIVKLLVNILVIATLVCGPLAAYAIDHVKTTRRTERNDLQRDYLASIVHAALEATSKEYGPYKYSEALPGAVRDRSIKELVKGDRINLLTTTLRPEYVGKVLIVPFPVRRGILSYRLALVHKDDQALFEGVNSPEQLHNFSVGLYTDLSTWTMMKDQGFPLVSTVSHLTMFSMLEHRRFQYTFRGAHEAYDELDRLREHAPNVIVEPSRAFYLFLPTLMMVSPQQPRLAERMEKGLVSIFQNGKFAEIFDKHYLGQRKKAGLHKRKIIRVDNSLDGTVDFLDLPGIWYKPEEDITK